MSDKNTTARVAGFSKRLINVLEGDVLPQLQFYMTHHCNLACRGCYMCANPARPSQCIPSSDIEYYMKCFLGLSDFNKAVCFSGGEIFILPVQYLEYNIQKALDSGLIVEIKTNGAWIDNDAYAKDVFDMLRGLRVPRGICATDDEIKDFLSGIPKSTQQKLGKAGLRRLLEKQYEIAALDMAISVDDTLHPGKSAQWFKKIADCITADKRLNKNVELCTFTVAPSASFFENRVLADNGLHKHSLVDYNCDCGQRFKFMINGKTVNAVFGEMVDVSAPHLPEDDMKITLPQADGGDRLVFFFHPDRTVCFENIWMQPVGRVSYVDKRGNYKNLDQLINEMYIKMVRDFKQKISR